MTSNEGRRLDEDDNKFSSSSTAVGGIRSGITRHSSSRQMDETTDDEEYDRWERPERSERRGLLPLQRRHESSTMSGRQRDRKKISLRRKLQDRRLRQLIDDENVHNSNNRYHSRRRNNDAISSSNSTKYDWLRPYWLGLGLFCILFAFWILDSLKDPVFGALIGGRRLESHLPTAKMLSVGTTLALVCLMEYISQERKKSANNSSSSGTGQTDVDVVSADDIMSERGGPWKAMNIASSKPSSGSGGSSNPFDYTWDQHENYESYGNQHSADDDHVPSSMFATMCVPYCILFAMIAYMLQFNPSTAWVAVAAAAGRDSTTNHDVLGMSPSNKSDNQAMAWKVLGYGLYAAIESFGSLAVATFWSYTNSTLALHDAEAYYGTIIAFAQMGAIAGSTLVTLHIWSSITLFIVACLVILLHVLVMVMYSRRFPPTSDVLAAAANDEPVVVPDGTKLLPVDGNEPTLWSGVHLILKHNYVLLILGVSCLYEVSLTCLNYQMTLMGWSRFEESTPTYLSVGTTTAASDQSETSNSGGSSSSSTFDINMSFTQFMGHYGQMVNISSLVLSLFIFPLLIQHAGVKYTLRIFPTLLLLANIIAFGTLPGNLAVLFFSISLLKAMTYSIHDPVKEILYIPTSNAIKFKAKFWIDVVGARFAKAIGSSINHYSGSVHRSIRIASAPSLLTATGLWFVCYRVGLQFDELVESGTIVGLDDDPLRMDHLEYSGEHEDDGDNRGAVRETNESIQLTAL